MGGPGCDELLYVGVENLYYEVQGVKPMMSRIHLRMARAALNWTLKELADKAEVNMNTISRYETGGSMLSDTLEKIESVLRSEGVIFIEEDEELGPGIRLRRKGQFERQTPRARKSDETKPEKTRKSKS